MLVLEYLQEHDIYMAIPVVNGKPDPNREYVFATQADQLAFLKFYFSNPVAAEYAYCQRLGIQ